MGTPAPPPTQFDKELKARVQKSLKSLAAATRLASGLPKAGDTFELCAANGVFAELMGAQQHRMVQLMHDLYAHAGVRLPPEFLSDQIDDDDRLECLGICLDEASGEHQSTSALVVGPVKNTRLQAPEWIAKKVGIKAPVLPSKSVTAQLPIERPQKSLPKDFVDNSSNLFRNKLKFKHNALKQDVSVAEDSSGRGWAADNETGGHPYYQELEHWKPLKIQLQPHNVLTKWCVVSDCKLTIVSELKQLIDLCAVLKKQRDFAVDLEHNDYRSYLGLTSLMQISTRTEDYIVDPFPLWTHMHLLNDPFTDPTIVKVFHGCYQDVMWLQRDFGIYLVNVFDTGLAMRRLNFSKFSLKFLVQDLCAVELNKHWQMQDWRRRPLPPAMLSYAREDTHYLLYCYDVLRQRLVEKGNADMIKTVLSDTKNLLIKHYAKPVFSAEDTARRIISKSQNQLSARQHKALCMLAEWRDTVAREVDESANYVLPNHMMLQLALALPRETQGILALCQPVPPLVHRHVQHLQQMLVLVRDNYAQLGGGGMHDDDQDRRLVSFVRERVPWLYDAHDYTHTRHNDELRPATANQEVNKSSIDAVSKSSPKLQIFSETAPQAKVTRRQVTETIVNDWMTPYERYQLALKAAEQKLKTERPKETKGDGGGDKRYTHRDASSGIGNKPTEYCAPTLLPDDPVEPKNTPASINFDDDDLLTKEKLKKKKKHQAAKGPQAEIDTKAHYGLDLKARKRAAGELIEELKAVPFDYKQAKMDMDKANNEERRVQSEQAQQNTYDPQGNLTRPLQPPRKTQRGGKKKFSGGRGAKSDSFQMRGGKKD